MYVQGHGTGSVIESVRRGWPRQRAGRFVLEFGRVTYSVVPLYLWGYVATYMRPLTPLIRVINAVRASRSPNGDRKIIWLEERWSHTLYYKCTGQRSMEGNA